MNIARIAELLAPFLASSPEEESPLHESRRNDPHVNDSRVNNAQLEQVSLYIDLLLRWNRRINLTAIRNPEEIVTRHFGESFFLAQHCVPRTCVARAPSPANARSATHSPSSQPPIARQPERALTSPEPISSCHPERSDIIREADDVAQSKEPGAVSSSKTPRGVLPAPSNPLRVIDVGSGAGFPALPLKIWAPHIHLTLIESNHKKAAFLREVARAIFMTNVHAASAANINVLADRAEILATSPDHPQAEIVTLRAVERFETILPQAAAFVAPQGHLALLIGSAQLSHLSALSKFKWQPPLYVPKSYSRLLSIGALN